jgi:hypothetical protein
MPSIHLIASIFCQRVLAESALRIAPLVNQSLPAFIGPGAGAESNVANVGGHERVIYTEFISKNNRIA